MNWGATKNNGNLQSATYANGGLTFTDNFSYDGVNRLLTANDSGGWSRTFTYDAFGNMTAAGNPGVTSLPFNSNNQIVGASYDQAGNQLRVNRNTLGYDFENHIVNETDGVSQAIETYVYDGDGRRVEKYGPGGTPRTVFVYDALGRLAAEYNSTATVPPCITCYLSDDHLGTPRLITDSNGLVAERHDYLPFGEEVAAGTFGRNQTYGSTAGLVNQKFTGKERDAESGLDYFGARYYGSALGRFTSADIPFADQDEYDPQSWNLYSYVRNNPLRNIDPDGRTCTFAKTSSGADIITDADGKGCAELHDNTVHAYDEPGIAMLASVGAKLTDPHEWVDLTSRAARSAASVEWPLASNIAECTVPGGDCENDGTSLLAKAPIWSRTNRLSRVKNAYAHWLKHGKEFPNLQNAKQYAEAAENFVTNPPAGTLSKLRPNGETVLYEPSTNTFAVKGADGAPKTMFKPSSGANYFNAQ